MLSSTLIHGYKMLEVNYMSVNTCLNYKSCNYYSANKKKKVAL